MRFGATRLLKVIPISHSLATDTAILSKALAHSALRCLAVRLEHRSPTRDKTACSVLHLDQKTVDLSPAARCSPSSDYSHCLRHYSKSLSRSAPTDYWPSLTAFLWNRAGRLARFTQERPAAFASRQLKINSLQSLRELPRPSSRYAGGRIVSRFLA
jgi:hypothetical protein